jgi:hypothetical protein
VSSLRGVRSVEGATTVIRRSLAGASCTQFTSRATRLAAALTWFGKRAASTRARARKTTERRCAIPPGLRAAGKKRVDNVGRVDGAAVRRACAWGTWERCDKRRSRSVSATLVIWTVVLTSAWSSSFCRDED